MKRGTWRVALIAASVSVVLSACGKKDAGDEAKGASLVSVETARVTVSSFTPRVHAVGAVVSSARGYAELSAPAPSRVSRVLVALGDRVRAGQTLVELDGAALRAAAGGADAARDAAQRAYDRTSALAKDGILPHKAVDQATSDLAQANAAAVAARRTYALSTLTAPISGVVTTMNAVMGSSVDAAQPLVAIADPEPLQVSLQLSPADAAGVRAGAVVTLYPDDSPVAKPIARGVVATISAAIDSATRAVPIRVRLVSSVRPLRLGETIVGSIALASTSNALSIPAAALVPDSTGFRVYVVRNGVAYATSVEIGARGDSLVQVTTGLSAGETVVTSGAYGLEDSSKVTVPKR